PSRTSSPRPSRVGTSRPGAGDAAPRPAAAERTTGPAARPAADPGRSGAEKDSPRHAPAAAPPSGLQLRLQACGQPAGQAGLPDADGAFDHDMPECLLSAHVHLPARAASEPN